MKEIIYSNTWKSEYQIGYDQFGYYLMPTKNTNFNILPLGKFEEESFGKFVLRLDNPENYHLSWEDVIDIEEINGILAIICEKNGKLSVNPAFGGSAMVMDSYYMDLGTYGNWGDYIQQNCPSCNHSWYFNQRKIPNGKVYEHICPKCGALLKRKKVQ